MDRQICGKAKRANPLCSYLHPGGHKQAYTWRTTSNPLVVRAMDGGLVLKKKYRLRKNKDFQAVYKGKNAVATSAVVLYIRDNAMGGLPRLGFSVSKKLGNAVVRNRCRRRLREAARTLLPEMRGGADYVFIARAPMKNAGFSGLRKDIRYLLKRKNAIVSQKK